MLSNISLTFVLTGLVSLSLARELPNRMEKRQGTLVVSTNAGDFGSCSVPQIQGGLGFDGRKEFSFEPVDKKSFNHGSAQNIGIITQFICDTLVNNCAASTAAHDLCSATQTSVGAGKNDGALADKFNAAFGVKTNFANVAGSISSETNNPAPTVISQPPSPVGTVGTVTITVTLPCASATVAPLSHKKNHHHKAHHKSA